MIQYFKQYFTTIILLFVVHSAFATHNRAGEIIYEQVDALTYKVTVITYTNTAPGVVADRSELEVFWGDNTSTVVQRTSKVDLPNYYRRNEYVGTHTYPGAGTYQIIVEDPNRNEGVLNIPNSVEVMFSLKTTLQINSFTGANNTPILLNPPIDRAGRYAKFIHNPSAYDPDGDSLSYELTTCLGNDGNPIENYILPEASNAIYVDAITGDFVWDTPVKLGIYNIAIKIIEWRNGVRIGEIIRDMQIEVYDTDNEPPVLNQITDHCILADSLFNYTISATDNINQQITLQANGGPFNLTENNATFNQTITNGGYSEAIFSWQTNCSHVRQQPYQVTFKATDNDPKLQLVDYKNMFVQIIAKAPTGLTTSPSVDYIMLNWDNYACNSNNLVGYKIYRKKSFVGYKPDECVTGVPETTGYVHIATINTPTTTNFKDDNNAQGLNQGFDYCYMITALFKDGAESYPSLEICTNLIRGVPIVTKASVDITDQAAGKITYRWLPPQDFDTITTPGPFRYLIFRNQNLDGTNYSEGIVVNGFLSDQYIDQNQNTTDNPHSYKMGLYRYNTQIQSWEEVGVANTASTPFLKLYPSDKRVTLTLQAITPWENQTMDVYRKNQAGLFEKIGSTPENFYTDMGLENGKTYCYKVKTIGSYGLSDLPSPIENFSQEACATPIDTIPPCAPELSVQSFCTEEYNQISWTNPNNTCAEKGTVAYKLFYSPTTNGSMELLQSFNNPEDTSYIHYPELSMAGCYAVAAIDSTGNESALSNKTCTDICAYYELPNVFSPDNNGLNDLFKPLPYSRRFVEKIDMKIYTRQGSLVFQTQDPDINWDGTNQTSGKKVADGVYYYNCDVYEYRLTGLETRHISGFLYVKTLINTNNQ